METVLKQPVNKKQCSFCQAKEGKKRPVGGYTVILRRVDIMGTEKLACQSCFIKYDYIKKQTTRKLDISNHESFIQKLKHFFLNVAH